MKNERYTNKQLAKDYLMTISWPHYLHSTYRIIRDRISGVDIDISSFYQEHRSLKELNVAGIGRETKRVLELILERGKDGSRKIIKKETEEKRQKILDELSLKDIPSTEAISDDYAQREIEEEGLCDNIARSLEGD
ncbi:MAG: hypothetical protein KKA64_03325 [Nanoarchaeota archaeon]|nr:hypothetical protein [Nanoarchaeota archaeon]